MEMLGKLEEERRASEKFDREGSKQYLDFLDNSYFIFISNNKFGGEISEEKLHGKINLRKTLNKLQRMNRG